VLWRLWQDPNVRNVARAVKEGTEIFVEARSAPGTDELREMGCDEAMAIDFDRVLKLAERFNDGGVTVPDEQQPDKLVMCQVRRANNAPTCTAVASTYLAAAPRPKGNIWVMTQAQGSNERQCSRMYSPDGKDLGDAAAGLPAPTPPE
jgi:hypothetical protein